MQEDSLGVLSEVAQVRYCDGLVIKIREQNPSLESRLIMDVKWDRKRSSKGVKENLVRHNYWIPGRPAKE